MNDARLIDANKAEEYLYEHLDDLHMIDAMNAINEMPTVDAVPVKRWRWIDIGHDKGLKCSNCGKRIRYRNGIKTEITVKDGRFEHTHEASQNGYYFYCPKCGSMMLD